MTREDSIVFCGIIGALLFEDGEIARVEFEFLNSLMDSVNIDKDDHQSVWDYARSPTEVHQRIEQLRRAGLADALIGHLHQAAMADGVMHPREAAMITQIDQVIRLRLGAERYPIALSGLNQRPLQERYAVQEMIGAGAFGEVFLATDRQRKEQVVIKKLRAEVGRKISPASKAETEDRFWREVDVLSKLTSPHSVRLLDAGFDVRTPYMVLEYLKGTTLQEAIKTQAPMPVERVQRILLQMLSALAEAHQLGIIHRDLKPANIILTGDGLLESVHVLDYGMAGVMEGFKNNLHISLTFSGQIMGTPWYMPSEQFMESSVRRPQSDIYAVALMAIECLTGQRVVPGRSSMEALQWLASGNEVSIPNEVAEDALGPLLKKASAKQWTHRYASAVEMFAALEEALDAATKREKTSGGVFKRLWRGFSRLLRSEKEPQGSPK